MALLGLVLLGVVPDKYRDLYDELEKVLKSAEARVAGGLSSHCPLYGTNLTAANANRGGELLQPRVRDGVIANLDAFKALGVKAVAVSIPYPVLAEDFPRSSEYRAFYGWVIPEVRKRGFAVFVESGTAFPEPLGKLPVRTYYRRLTLEKYKTTKRTMVHYIVKSYQPDYLTVENEPDVQGKNTGLRFTPERWVELLNAYLNGLDRGGTKIGAGQGTWLPLAHLERIARETRVDYLDIHIYPIQQGFLASRVSEAAGIARSHGKRIIIGEAWLYKARVAEMLRAGSEPAIFARDAYSFWQPLDIQFIRTVSRIARAEKFELLSFFWPQFFFGYAEYSPELEARGPAQIMEAGHRAAIPNILAKRLSESGNTLRAEALCGR
ncbi:MAG: hypothetical protein V2G42_08855 [bacterium JZ-2024 1]